VRSLLWFAATVLLLVADAASAAPTRLLFVGNSLTYVGNLPAVLDALAAANGRSTSSDMLVSGGATLSDRVADGSVDRATAAQHYDYVILQERGGNLIGAAGDASLRDTKAAHGALVRLARRNGAEPILLGTYQGMPQPSRALVAAESAQAKRLSIGYVAVSQRLQAGLNSAPDAEWFAADRMHPGPDLILLDALLLYRALFGALPPASALTVEAPMYDAHAGFAAATLVRAGSARVAADTAYRYSRERVEGILAIAASR
jgi:hypothetical protein